MKSSQPSTATYRAGDPDPPTMPLLWRVGVAPVIIPAVEPPAGKSLSSQMVAFAVVGGLSTAIDFGGFNALHFGLGFDPVTSKLLAVSASTLFSYYGNRRWSFAVSETNSHRRDLPLFIGLNGIGLLIALAAVAGTRYGLGLSSALALNVIGNGGGALLGTAFRFWAYRSVVFRTPEPPAPVNPIEPPHPRSPGTPLAPDRNDRNDRNDGNGWNDRNGWASPGAGAGVPSGSGGAGAVRPPGPSGPHGPGASAGPGGGPDGRPGGGPGGRHRRHRAPGGVR